MRKVEGTATISIEELDRLREREQWYNDLRGKLKNIVGKLDTEEYDKEMKKIDDTKSEVHYAISEMSTEELKEIPLIIGG